MEGRQSLAQASDRLNHMVIINNKVILQSLSLCSIEGGLSLSLDEKLGGSRIFPVSLQNFKVLCELKL